MRPMVDVDLLVEARHVARLHEGMAQKGFRRAEGETSTGTAFEFKWLSTEGVTVEVHKGLDWPEVVRAPPASLLARRQTGGPHQLPFLDPNDLFLHLAAHAAKDMFVAWERAVVDAHVLESGADLDPQIIATRAREWGVQVAVFVLLAGQRRATNSLGI